MSAETTNKIDRMIKLAKDFEFLDSEGHLVASIDFTSGDLVFARNHITRDELYDFVQWIGKLIY